jgi:hypothetical protein
MSRARQVLKKIYLDTTMLEIHPQVNLQAVN